MDSSIFKHKLEQPVALKIQRIVEEAEDIKSFFFSRSEGIINDSGYMTRSFGEKGLFSARPGQFVFLWIPRLNMKPFGVSYMSDGEFGVTVCKVGGFTEELFKKKPGDHIGIQGPHGSGFNIKPGKAILVAGGYGVAPLAYLAEELEKIGADVSFIIGAKFEDLLLYRKRFKGSKIKTTWVTDDGSFGKKGYTTTALEQELGKDNSSVDLIYTCGPEVMMKGVIDISDRHDIACEASLERYMKCGFGICGQCCCDSSGVRVCTNGPVFSKEFIKKNISEFGRYKRDSTGNKV
ncbi:dihydroorotate dehydrogenase electron transfer subunit [Candidatus Woesearchaeota archaeon]|nr:dihydroorotate dehydrogenase electron transfer subunit [Candidatus Woesearchaeota archaeon]